MRRAATAIVLCMTVLFVPGWAPGQSVEEIPSFSVPLLGSDEPLTDADLRGRYSLVSVWSTTCVACVAELPYLADAHERFGDRVRFVSISLDRNEEAVHEFRRIRYPMPWVHARGSWGDRFTQDFDVKGTPFAILIAPTGEIVATTQELLGDELQETLARVVGARPGSS